jgi:choice-of-anchor A domain-containing protein
MKLLNLISICLILIPVLPAKSQINPEIFHSSLFATGSILGLGINAESSLVSGASQSIRAANLANIYAAGNVSLISANVTEEVALGGQLFQKASQINHITYFNEPRYHFNHQQNALYDFSMELNQRLANGVFQRIEFNQVELSGTDPSLNIFDADDFYFNDHVNFNVPAGSIAVVNVRGLNPNFSMLSFNRPARLYQGIDPGNLLINFPDLLKLGIDGSQIGGTILAPRASISMLGTSIYGSTLATNIHARAANFYARPFTGIDRQIVTEPLSAVGFLMGGLMILAMFRKLFVLDTV